MKTSIIGALTFLGLSTLSPAAMADSSDLTCRNKAKEIALQTYSLCMTEQKSHRAEALRRAYEEEALKLKAQYEAEIAQLESASESESKEETTTSPKVIEATSSSLNTKPLLDKKQSTAPSSQKGITKVLPTKKGVTKVLPIQTIMDAPKVVNISASQSPDLDNE